jgi:chemotaxis family two-component system response regulator Rcp1
MSTEPWGRPVEILLVEDNPGDVDLARESLEANKVRNRLSVVENGADALPFLRRQGKYAGAPRPDVILLDLNLPGKPGLEVLAEIKGDDALKHIPVVILTTSQDDADVLRSYRLHGNCYVTKPLTLDRFIEVVKGIEHFWFTIVTLPPREHP